MKRMTNKVLKEGFQTKEDKRVHLAEKIIELEKSPTKNEVLIKDLRQRLDRMW